VGNLNEALNSAKLNRLQRQIEVEIRQMKTKADVDPLRLNRMTFALDALRDIASSPSLVDGKVSGINNRFIGMLRRHELELRTEVLRSDPDLEKVVELYLKIKSLTRLSSEREMYDTRTNMNENSNRIHITRPAWPTSEFSQDLKAMYGHLMKKSDEDIQSDEDAADYINEESKVNAAGNYTKPGMRKKLFKRIMAGNKGGDPGEWSARKAQLLAREYKKSGGGYKD
jgi:hypothetical protein